MKRTTWLQLRLRALAFVTVACTAVISFDSSRDLADRAGFGWLSWLFPVTLDVVAAFGMDIWMRREAAVITAACLTLTTVSLSMAANITDHYLIQGTPLAAFLGAIPPAMLAWLLLVLHRYGSRKRQAHEVGTVSVPVPAPTHLVEIGGLGNMPVPGPAPRTAEEILRTRVEELDPDHITVPVPDQPVPAVAPRIAYDRTEDPDPVVPPWTVPTEDRVAGDLPVPVPPESDAERTQIMRPVPPPPSVAAKAPPVRPNGPAKVSPARRSSGPAKLTVARPVPERRPVKEADRELAARARRDGNTTKKTIMSAYGVGSNRAVVIARLAKEEVA